jgi:hypothetical protein
MSFANYVLLCTCSGFYAINTCIPFGGDCYYFGTGALQGVSADSVAVAPTDPKF